MKPRGPQLEPELESFLGFRNVPRSVPNDVRARVLARSRAYASGEHANLAGPELEARSPSPATSSDHLPNDVRARILARSRAYVTDEHTTVASVPLEAKPPRPSVSQDRAVRQLALVASIAIAVGAAGAIAARRSRAPGVPPRDSLVTAMAVPVAVRNEPISRRPPAILPTSTHHARITRPHSRMVENPSAEAELLERAQLAYASGDFSDTLVLVAEHARRFPRGPLAEECEALRVKSLLGAGRDNDARRVSAAFAARFPRSVLLTRIQEAPMRP